MTATPLTVAPGGTVYISGTGFSTASGAYATISWTYGSSYAALTAGAFTNVALVVPAGTPSGYYLITVADTAGGSNTTYFSVASAFTLGATAGYVGDVVSVTGSGFTANSSVLFYWDISTVSFASFTSTAAGAISGTITIPPTYRGSHTISTSSSGASTQSFLVYSKLVITPTSGGVGDTVSLTGTGFGASNSVAITVDSASVTATTPVTPYTGSTGSFSCTFVMPSGARGSHTVQATDSGGYAVATFTIGQKITLTPTSGGVGDNVIVSGSGFTAYQTISFKLDGSALTVSPSTVTSDSAGAFSNVSFTIPSLGGGAHLVRATDQDGNYYEATLTLTPKISITPTNGTVGTQITVTGSGFAPGAPVAISWDNLALSPAASTTATAAGTISVTFTSPASAKGNHTVKAADTSTNSATAVFATTPKIVLNPTSGGYQDSVSITFTGFTASSTATTQILSGSTVYSITTTPATVQTDAYGNATATFSVPGVYNGNWTIQASDAGGASAQATLAVTPKLILAPATGAAGDVIVVTGTGFGVSKDISLTYNGVALATTPAAVTSSVNGSFSFQFTVPATAAGSIALKASDGTNTATQSFSATVKATVSKTTTQSDPGNVGMDMTVNGTGFKASTTITVTFESTPVTVASVTSDVNGSFTATFKVPAAAAGNHTIKATDGTTTQSFAFFMDSTAPGAATLLTPLDKAKPKQPATFTWNAVSDPSSVTYTLQISQDANFGTLILEKTGLTAATYKLSDLEKLKSAGSKTPYYWRVRATDLAGNVGAWSTANTFTIGFIWPSWMIHVWYALGIIVALILGLWLGRRMAYQSY